MMDNIQSVLDVPSKKFFQEPNSIFKQPELSEASYPLLISYMEWLRKINSVHNQPDVMHENEQYHQKFKFLYKHNLFFFLMVTGQLKVIDRPFENPSYTTKLRYLIGLVKKIRCQKRQAPIKKIMVGLTFKQESQKPEDSANKLSLFMQLTEKKILINSITTRQEITQENQPINCSRYTLFSQPEPYRYEIGMKPRSGFNLNH